MNRILLVILVLAAVARSRGIADPWSHGDHNGWGGAFYSNIARNYARYGYVETRFAPVVSTGTVPPENRRYYLTHPPGIGLALSLSFALFGESEWAARLVPLLFSLGSIFLLYRLAEKVYSREVALVAAAFFSVLPLETLYGAHVDRRARPSPFSGCCFSSPTRSGVFFSAPPLSFSAPRSIGPFTISRFSSRSTRGSSAER